METTSAEQRWRALIAEQERSGLSVRDFARQRELSPWSLYGWRSKLGLGRMRSNVGTAPTRRRRSEPYRDLVVVDVVGPDARSGSRESDGFELELDHGVRVHVPRGFDDGELVRLVRALRSSC